MRTTVTFDDDTAAAVEQVRRTHGIGVSAAVNELVRRGVAQRAPIRPFVQETSAGYARIDVTNVSEALETLEGPLSG